MIEISYAQKSRIYAKREEVLLLLNRLRFFTSESACRFIVWNVKDKLRVPLWQSALTVYTMDI